MFEKGCMCGGVSPARQGISSAVTSTRLVPSTIRMVDWKRGSRNLDLGGGRFADTSQVLATKGVINLVYDPFNQSAIHNQLVLNAVKAAPADTVTVNNVLNVIAEAQVRQRVIEIAARHVKAEGTCYFLIYQGDGTGAGRITRMKDGMPASWQNNRPASHYVIEIMRCFKRVSRRGNLIVAKTAQRLKADDCLDQEKQ